MTAAAGFAGAAALALSCAMLFAARIDAVLRFCSWQAAAVAVAALAQGLAVRSAALPIAAVLAFALSAVGLSLVLGQFVARASLSQVIARRGGVAASTAAVVVLVVAAMTGALRLMQIAEVELLAPGLAVLLLGLLVMALQTHPAVPALGLLSAQNGVLLAAWSAPGLTVPILLLAAVPLVPALVIAGEWLLADNHPASTSAWA
jgi:hydrogenase-4 membrane subunit HyfE